ncbi:MAG TPA: hypothetical protein PK313_09190, partial [Myxococcota bacterium]|nr:hypothetical protein [Myxococcota bacterium]
MRTPAAILLAILFLGLPAGAVVPKGARVDDFAVEGPDGSRVRLVDETGRHVLIIYEDRASANQNLSLKQRLWDLHRKGRLDERMMVMPIADVRAFREWPASQYARKAVDAERKRTGRVLFADFTGAAGKALEASPGRSTLVLLAPGGEVLWSAEGALSKADASRLVRLLLARAGVPQPAKPARERAADTDDAADEGDAGGNPADGPDA